MNFTIQAENYVYIDYVYKYVNTMSFTKKIDKKMWENNFFLSLFGYCFEAFLCAFGVYI